MVAQRPWPLPAYYPLNNIGNCGRHLHGSFHIHWTLSLDDPYNEQCPLYYAVTANHEADELIPRSLTVDIESCDQTISKRMTIYNVEAGYDINYNTGETRK